MAQETSRDRFEGHDVRRLRAAGRLLLSKPLPGVKDVKVSVSKIRTLVLKVAAPLEASVYTRKRLRRCRLYLAREGGLT
jgi:hypothetical protein